MDTFLKRVIERGCLIERGAYYKKEDLGKHHYPRLNQISLSSLTKYCYPRLSPYSRGQLFEGVLNQSFTVYNKQ